MCKLNLQCIGQFETFEYGFSHIGFHIWKPIYAGFRWVRCDLTMKKRGREDYDHGIAFQRVAWLGILQSAEKQRAQKYK